MGYLRTELGADMQMVNTSAPPVPVAPAPQASASNRRWAGYLAAGLSALLLYSLAKNPNQRW